MAGHILMGVVEKRSECWWSWMLTAVFNQVLQESAEFSRELLWLQAEMEGTIPLQREALWLLPAF